MRSLWLQLSSAAQLLGGAFHVGSLTDAAAVGPALKALTSSTLPQPLLATLASPRIKASQQVRLTSAACCMPLLVSPMLCCSPLPLRCTLPSVMSKTF